MLLRGLSTGGRYFVDGGEEIVCDIRKEHLAYPEGVVGWGSVASGTKLFGKEHLPFLDSYLRRVAVPSEFHEKGKEKGKESGRGKREERREKREERRRNE